MHSPLLQPLVPVRFLYLGRYYLTAVCGLLLLTAVIPREASAEALHTHLTSKHRFSVGGYWQESEASLTAVRGNLEPTAVDLSTIGLKDRDFTWMAEYRYKKNPRWQYSASLYRYRQTGDLAAETEFNFDGVEVEV